MPKNKPVIKKYKADWSSNDNHLVLCADIMGFKKMVAKPESHPDTEKQLRQFIDELKHALAPLKTKGHIRLSLFSDSIFLATDKDTLQCLNLIIQASSIIMHLCKKFNFPLNGCIAKGTLTFDDIKEVAEGEDREEMVPMPLCFGYAISEAYIVQNAIQVYGIVFHPNMEQMLGLKSVLNQDFPIYKIAIPLRTGGAARLYYLSHCHVNTPMNQKGDCIDEYYKGLNDLEAVSDLRARTYIYNTIQICNEINDIRKKRHEEDAAVIQK